jgi:hypothetical protein
VVPLQAGIKDAPNDERWSYEWCAVMVLQDRIGMFSTMGDGATSCVSWCYKEKTMLL